MSPHTDHTTPDPTSLSSLHPAPPATLPDTSPNLVLMMGVGLVTERIWLFSWSSFGRRLRVSLAPGGLGVGEGVEHELAPGERRVDREVRVPGAETDACGCRTVSGAQSAVA
jgi:hypothetical protein